MPGMWGVERPGRRDTGVIRLIRCRMCALVFIRPLPLVGSNLRALAESTVNLRVSCPFRRRANWPANCTEDLDVSVPCGGSMRPYLILLTVVLMAAAAFAQSPLPYSGCFYGCAPFIPRITTPEISFQQYSPNPVGARNATTGLIAGATNSTLSQIQGSTSSVYSVAVWEQGGDAPLITPEVRLWPETVGREGHIMRGPMHDGMLEDHMRAEQFRDAHPFEARVGEERMREMHSRDEHPRDQRSREERASEEARIDWTYINGPVNPSAEASGIKKAGRTYTNDDVKRQNDKNGMVKYDDKTEKI